MSQKKWPLSINSGNHSMRPGAPRIPLSQALDHFASVGFDAVDVNLAASIQEDPLTHEPVLDGDRWRDNVKALREQADRLGLQLLNTHAPYQYRYLDVNNPKYPWYEEMMHRSIEATALLGGSHSVVHPIFVPDRSHTLVKETVQALRPLVDYGERFGVRVTVENLCGTPPEELLEIVEQLDTHVCWDAGHANIRGLDQESSLVLLGSRVKVLHLHDNYGSRGRPISDAPQNDLHQPPYFGNLDWDSLLRGLARIHYEGAFNFEMGCHRAPETLRPYVGRYLEAAGRGLLCRLEQLEQQM